jgi:hypothetical protein
MLSLTARRQTAAFVSRAAFQTTSRAISSTAPVQFAKDGQAEVVLVGCGAPNRGMYVTTSDVMSLRRRKEK